MVNYVIDIECKAIKALHFFLKEDRSYLVAGKLEKYILPGMFLGVEDIGITFTTYEEGDLKLLIFGGGDHKVGQCKKEG